MNLLFANIRAADQGTAPTDSQLLDQFATSRDEDAFAELVRRHAGLVWGVCRRGLSNPPDAEDAFQATFLVLLRRAGALPRHATLGPWLHEVARWCCRNVRRANRRRLARTQVGLEDAIPAPEPDRDTGPDLDAAVRALPEKYRVPVILCYFQGWTKRAAAEYLGWPEGTLSARLNRALARLRAKLTDRDPVALLAVAGAVLAPPALADAAVRLAAINATATGALPPLVLATSEGALRMFRMRTLRHVVAGLVLAVGTIWLGAELVAQPPKVEGPPAARSAPSVTATPTLKPGKWELVDVSFPMSRRTIATLTIGEKDGKPTITNTEDESLHYQAKGLTITDRRLTFTTTRDGPFEEHFEGLLGPADPTRILGSFGNPDMPPIQVVLELTPASGGRKPDRSTPPPEWESWLKLARTDATENFAVDHPQFRMKPVAEQETLKAAAAAARKAYFDEGPKLHRALVANHPNSPFGYEAAMSLFQNTKLGQDKPTPAEIDTWARAARTFAATHGPRFEAATVGKIASALSRQAAYRSQAQTYAVEADKLALAAGMPAAYVTNLAEIDEERAAWAAQKNPPAAGSTWTVTITGRVTDPKGGPVAGAEVWVNNTSGVKVLTQDGSYKTTTGPNGEYKITLKCVGESRLQVRTMGASKTGYVQAATTTQHKLLPNQSATVDFTLSRGEPFGGTLKLRPTAFDRQFEPDPTHLIHITGPEVNEILLVQMGKRFEMSLPPGQYTVELERVGGKKLTWPGLKTGKTDHVLDEPPFRYTPETVGAGFDELWTAMDRHYSYFTLRPDVDWAKLGDTYRPRAIKATSADELAVVLKEMLEPLKDGHVWIEMPDGKRIGTYRSVWSYNGNRKVVEAQLTDVTVCGEYAIVGTTKPDGFGYFLMTRQSAATPELVAKAVDAIRKRANAPGFVVDLRTANGGSEPLAQEVAQLFCGEKVVYAKSRYRSGRGHDEFGDDQPRELLPTKIGKPYLKPVVCLLGPGCVSSGEGFAKMMAALPHVKTIGLPTAGSSGNPAAVEVGESGVLVYFSRWVDLLPDGTPIQGHGVPPRIRVEAAAEAYRDADPTLAKGLEVLRERRKE